ncbi:hypothetical protein ACFQEX_24040 [Roseibium salinum]|uniref:hypothetical protein n=1 Tax=Roseibium salinum TaxID=1604349 RepID=UPI00360E2BCE
MPRRFARSNYRNRQQRPGLFGKSEILSASKMLEGCISVFLNGRNRQVPQSYFCLTAVAADITGWPCASGTKQEDAGRNFVAALTTGT